MRGVAFRCVNDCFKNMKWEYMKWRSLLTCTSLIFQTSLYSCLFKCDPAASLVRYGIYFFGQLECSKRDDVPVLSLSLKSLWIFLPVFLCLCHYQENMPQLMFQSVKYTSLRAKSYSQNHPRSANSSWPPGIRWVQSKPEATNQLYMAVSWMASNDSGIYALVKSFLWVWAGPSDLFLINRIQQCVEMPLPKIRLQILSCPSFAPLCCEEPYGEAHAVKHWCVQQESEACQQSHE